VKTLRNPDGVHEPLGVYSHQVEISGGERLLMLAGQVGQRADGSIPDDPLEQLSVALDNVARNLEAAGMGVEDLVKLIFYHVGDVDRDRRRELLTAKLGAHRPCMTLLFISALAAPAYKVEVDAWASGE